MTTRRTALVVVFPKLDDDWSKSAAVAAATGNPAAVFSCGVCFGPARRARQITMDK